MFIRIISLSLILFLPLITYSEAREPKRILWPFEGILGTVDRQAAQRGAQVYLEVCSACHSLKHLYYRNLKDIGFSEEEIKELARSKTITDGPNDEGDMFERPAKPSDLFVPAYPNDQAARAANGGALPVDLSLIIKARENGANYLYSLLTGYEEAPADFNVTDGLYYNPYFENHQLAMPAPLSSDLIEYMDGTNATVEQMSRDVTIFLQWAAEPEMERRKSMGIKVIIFLCVFTVLFYLSKQKIWKSLK